MRQIARCMCANARSGRLRNNIRRQLIFEPADLVAQNELALLEPLHLDEIGARRIGQSRNGGVEVAVFLLKARQLVAQLALFVFGHRHQPGESRPARITAEDRSCRLELSRFPQSHSS